MFEKEEEQLTEIKKKYEEVSIPDHMDHYIQAGMDQALQTRRRRRSITFSSVAVAMVCILFLVSIRMSPVFAAYVGQIPGLERLVELVQGDKGLESALDHEFIQTVDKSDTKQGLTLTVDQIIADETKMVLFYTIESDQDYSYLMLTETKFTDESGEDISAVFGFDSHPDGIKKGETVTGKINIDFRSDAPLPKQVNVSTHIETRTWGAEIDDDQTWEIGFDVDHEKFSDRKKTYTINESVTIEDQLLTFKEITVYPTKIAIHIKYDEQNTKELFGFDDLAIVNEQGEEWASIENGITGQDINENEEILFLQSNFFEQPEDLYLQFSSIRALDKDKLDVIVDLEQEKLLKKPNDQLELMDISLAKKSAYVEFLIQRSNEFSTETFYQVFDHQYYDVDGNEYQTGNGFGFRMGKNDDEYVSHFSVTKPKVDGPITLKIIDYPTRISEDIKINVQ